MAGWAFRIVLIAAVGLSACCAARNAAPAVAGKDASIKTSPDHEIARSSVALPPPDPAGGTPAEYPGVHNVVAFGEGLYSGSVPEGDAGFDTLVALGVRTIISVDGARPDVERAERRGLRYVHLPIGYSGMDERRTLELARAVHDLPGPIYLHCHHGKHRSAGAAGAVAVTLGRLTADEALLRMKVSGTSPAYKGLYQCVSAATVADGARLLSADDSFPRVWRTSGLVRSMVEIEHAHEHLRLIEKAAWTTPRDHPDLVPAAEAGRLADLLRNLIEHESSRSRPAEYVEWMRESARLAAGLEDALVRTQARDAPGADRAAISHADLSGRLALIAQTCKDCHARYRD
ncbi:MAG: hypothetical protein LC135_11120 [Phycisphaerae bacterium]|jgi:protein tyrosine phosphatase (PTP) superfamily phosphohydrolase (DUF442 family)|nr:hypothetical protein [Phycisphaerae bacterium]MCZ2400398.1 hypothetical protein [Phycisphaerae bacterium]NUQ50241.1 hypothetical protein [Phycisphaerae bacterium]